MTYQDAIDFLYPLHRFGIKPGLERVRTLLDLHGSPHKRMGKIVHIAGTNGKGTVASALASIFQASGRKTALYTSPHLVDFTERIRIDGVQISRERIASYCALFREAVISRHCTFFEATTAIACAWFADENVDISIIETGMGGRLDATNILDSDYVVITSIAMDHTEWLGETPAMISSEKAAIIKKGCKVYTGVSESGAFSPIKKMAELCGAPLFIAGKDASCHVVSAEPGGLELEIRTARNYYSGLNVPVTGSFHASNVLLAVMVAEDAGVAASDISVGLGQLLQTGYRARLEKIGNSPAVLLDVSHNPEGMRETVNTLCSFRKAYRRVHVMLGLASDKNAQEIIRELIRLDCSFVVVNIPSERSFPAEILCSLCRKEGADAIVCDNGRTGLGYLNQHADEDDLILVTGSFYLAGEILASGI